MIIKSTTGFFLLTFNTVKFSKIFLNFSYQSKIRPTNGEIKVTLASAQATACANENNNVKLQ